MSLRDLVQWSVVATNRRWPFSVVNRLPYRAAIAAASRRMARLGEVSGLYLRNGLLGSDWVPGLSDIDLTVVLRDVPDPEREFALVGEVWAVYRSLKRLFPMLGELDVLTEAAVPVWSRFSIPGYEVRYWQPLLRGRSSGAHSEYEASEARLECDALHHALLVYRGVLMRTFFCAPRTPVFPSAVQRITGKVARYAALARGVSQAEAESPVDVPPASRSIASALACLDAAVREIELPAFGPDPRLELARRELPFGEANDRLSYGEEGIVSIVESYRARILLVEDARDPRLPGVLERLARAHDPSAVIPLVATPTVLEFLLRSFDPYLYTHLLRVGRVVQGAPVLLPEPPSESSFRQAVLTQVPNLLAIARSEHVVPPLDATFVAERSFELAIERALLARMLLEERPLSPWYHEAMAESRQVYRSVLARVAEIRQLHDRAGFEAFALLRSLGAEIAKGIESRGADESLARA